MLAPTPCADPDCVALAVNRGKCLEHQVHWQGSTRAARLPKDWRTRRAVVLRRDQFICYICKGPNADTVDHVVPGDDHSLPNLRAVHDRIAPHCHRFKTAKEANEVKQLNRPKRRR
jgi:5-methylcytosine-specific restriction protein A